MAAQPETRIKVFISYSRADKAFASDLVLGLAACGFAPYIDREDIAAGEDWAKRLSGLISEADTIIYVLSPDSLTSDQCSWEFKEALRLAKRVLPVVWRPIEDAQAPPELKRLNYIFFSGEGRTFVAGLAQLAEALRTDVDWIREHTRLAGLAARWAARGKSGERLLRGDELDAAMEWMGAKPMSAPAITDDQADFIKASSDARTEAERRAARTRAGLLTAVSAAALVFAALAVFGIWQWQTAKQTLDRLGISEKGRMTAEVGKVRAEQDVRAANVRLEAEVWLRTAPSSSGYYVVDKGWYQVAANYSGAIAEVEVSGGGRPSVTASGFIIEGGLVHPRYAGEPLLLVLPEAAPDAANTPATPVPSGQPPAPADTLPADAPRQPQGMLGQVQQGEEHLEARFPALGGERIAGAELVWKTPAHVAAEPPFMVWRLASKPPFGWRAVTRGIL